MKIGMDIDKKRQNALEKINETWFFESWLFEKINKVNKPLARLIKKKREWLEINKVRNDREIATDITKIQKKNENTRKTIPTIFTK